MASVCSPENVSPDCCMACSAWSRLSASLRSAAASFARAMNARSCETCSAVVSLACRDSFGFLPVELRRPAVLHHALRHEALGHGVDVGGFFNAMRDQAAQRSGANLADPDHGAPVQLLLQPRQRDLVGLLQPFLRRERRHRRPVGLDTGVSPTETVRLSSPVGEIGHVVLAQLLPQRAVQPRRRSLRARFQQPRAPLRRERVPVEAQLFRIGACRLLAAQRALGEMRADRVGNGVEPRHAGLRVERDGGAQAISEVLCQVRLVEGPASFTAPCSCAVSRAPTRPVLAEHGVGHEDVRVQVRITRHRHRDQLGDLSARSSAPPSSASGAPCSGRTRASRHAPARTPPGPHDQGGRVR